MGSLGLVPCCSAGKERGIFHSVGGRTCWRIDDRDGFVGIRPVKSLATIHRLSQHVQVPFRLSGMLRLKQDAHLYRPHAALECIVEILISRARGPGEIMNVVTM